MLSSRFTQNTLEKLPDELLLSICRYLSSADVLFSFYGLNSRLSQTISGYYQHVVIAKLPYTQFHCICTSILPHIGLNISSLVISNQWKGVLSTLFLNYFSDKMSLIFPQLKHLTFISFNSNSLKLFLNSLQNLPQLRGINLCFQYDGSIDSDGSETLLDRLFSANNNRLNSILFDDESIIFSVDDEICNRFYSNIQKLSLDIKTLCDLHQLLTILPQLISITVTINEDSSIPDNISTCTPVHSLKELQLQSFSPSWSYDELESVLKRIPNVKILSISIETYDDERLIDGKKFKYIDEHRQKIENDPLRHLLEYPTDDIDFIRIDRQYRTIIPTMPEKEALNDPHIRDCLQSFNGEHFFLRRNYNHFGSAITLLNVRHEQMQALKQTSKQDYEIDIIDDNRQTLIDQERDSPRKSAISDSTIIPTKSSWALAKDDLDKTEPDTIMPHLIERIPIESVDKENELLRGKNRYSKLFSSYPPQADTDCIEYRLPSEPLQPYTTFKLQVKCLDFRFEPEIEPMRIHRQFREALLIVGFVCFTMMIAVGAVALARYLGDYQMRLL
ncbi:unnamed protein product [Adineta steineri]|uniref:F-box domain-containing protein n=1 Tax=Adineta steineri TaxID=433720 RepID=A0A813QD69_9BILA|nr:unnamed protein product [Adineta steineri]